MKIQLQESPLINLYVVYQILKKLTTPFRETSAFRLGIIDADGNVLRKRHTLRTQEEQDSSTVLDTMIWKLRRLLEKLPGGKSKIASFAASLWLISESKNLIYYSQNGDILKEDLKIYLECFKPSKAELQLFEEIEQLQNAQVGLNEAFKVFNKE